MTTRVWSEAFRSSVGASAMLLAGAFVASVVALALPVGGVGRAITASLLIVACLAFCLSGHAASARPIWLVQVAMFVHVAGLAFWLGAFAPLVVLIREGGAVATGAISRFSRMILPAFLALSAAGCVLAWVELTAWRDLWSTRYGALLLAKLAVVGAVTALAALNRLVFSPRLLFLSSAMRRHFATSIRAEFLLAVLVLLLVAGWRFTPPPRS